MVVFGLILLSAFGVNAQNFTVSDTCAGQAAIFQYTGPTAGVDSTLWIFNVPSTTSADSAWMFPPNFNVTNVYPNTGTVTAGVVTWSGGVPTINTPMSFEIIDTPQWQYQDTIIACSDTITLDATQPGGGNTTYSWTGFPGGANTPTVEILPSYYFGYPPSNPNPTCFRIIVNCTITNDCGSETFSVVVFRNSASLIPNNITICPGDVLNLGVDFCAPVEHRMDYIWSNGSYNSNIQVSTAGTYYVTVTDDSCYQNIDSTTITVAQPFTFSFGPDTTLCPGDSIELNAGVGDSLAQFSWATPAGVTNPGNDSLCNATGPGEYRVIILDGADCFQVNDTIAIDVPQVIAPDLGPDTILCAGDTMTLDPGVPPPNGNYTYTYTWQDGSAGSSFPVTVGGTYSVTVSDPCSEYVDSVYVDQPPPVLIDLGPDQILCENDSILLDPTVPPGIPYDYLWSDGSTEATLWVYTDGPYWVQIQGDCDQGRDTVQIDPYVVQPFTLGPPPAEICDGQLDTLIASYPGAISYEWPDYSTDSTFVVSSSGGYWAIAYHQCGNTSSDTVDYVFENCDCNLFIPNAFSPNFQGPPENEQFRVVLTTDCSIGTFQMSIFNRWGKLMFYSEDIDEAWDGKNLDGGVCDQGVYMYRIYYELPNFTKIEIKTANGYIYLVK